MALYEKRSLMMTIEVPDSLSRGRLADHPRAGNRPRDFARIRQLRRLHDSFRNRPAAARFFYVAEKMRGCLRWNPSRTGPGTVAGSPVSVEVFFVSQEGDVPSRTALVMLNDIIFPLIAHVPRAR